MTGGVDWGADRGVHTPIHRRPLKLALRILRNAFLFVLYLNNEDVKMLFFFLNCLCTVFVSSQMHRSNKNVFQ